MEKLASSDSKVFVYKITPWWGITLFRASLLFTLISLGIAIFFGDFFIERNKQYGLKVILFLAGASSALALESLTQSRSIRDARSKLKPSSINETQSNIYIESLTIASPRQEEDKPAFIRNDEEKKQETTVDFSAQPLPSVGQASTIKDAQEVIVYLPPELYKQLKIRSTVEAEPMSAVAEQAISFYLTYSIDIGKIKSGEHQVVILEQVQQMEGSGQESSEQVEVER